MVRAMLARTSSMSNDLCRNVLRGPNGVPLARIFRSDVTEAHIWIDWRGRTVYTRAGSMEGDSTAQVLLNVDVLYCQRLSRKQSCL